MKRWWLPLALLLSLGVNVGVFATLITKRAQARRGVEAPAARFVGQLDRIADALRLEGEKRQRFLDSQRRFVAAVRQEGRRLEDARLALRDELLAARPDPRRVEELVEAVGRRSVALDRAFADNVLFVRDELEGAGERRYLRFLAEVYSRGRDGRRRGRR